MSDEGGDGGASEARSNELVRVGETAGELATRAGDTAFAMRWFRQSPATAALPLVGMLPMFVGLTQLGQGRDWLTFVLMGAGLATVIALFAKSQKLEPVDGTITVQPKALLWNGAPMLKRGRISQATVSQGEHEGAATWEVHLGAPNGLRQRLLARDEDSARAFVRALGLDPSRATATFRTQGPVAGWRASAMLLASWVASMTALVGTLAVFGFSLWALVPGALAAFAVIFAGTIPAMPRTVHVGSDGVRVEVPLSKPVLVPYAELERVVEDEAGVTLVKRDGGVVRLRLAKPQGVPGVISDALAREKKALVARITDAMRAPSEGAAVLDDGALARGDRDVRAWIASLRALVGRAEGGMRAAPVLRDHLWARVRDARAPEADRAGAAVVLAKLGDGRDRALLEETARSLASTRLRVAIECAAKQPGGALAHDDERSEIELERALETLTKPPQRGGP